MAPNSLEQRIQKINRSRKRNLLIADFFKERVFAIEHNPSKANDLLYQPIKKIYCYLEKLFYKRSLQTKEQIKSAEIQYWNSPYRFPSAPQDRDSYFKEKRKS